MLNKVTFTFLIFILAHNLTGQALSDNGTFSIAYAKGCAPFTVNITQILSLDPTISRQYTYEGEDTPTLDAFHTFADPGIYDIAQILGQDANKFDTIRVEVFDPQPPTFSFNQCSGNGVTVTATDTNYDFYRVYFTNNDSVTLNAGESTQPFFYSNSSDQPIRVKGFYTDAEENCGETTQMITTTNQLTPGVLNSLNVASIGVTDGAMTVRFNLAAGIVYNLEMSVDSGEDFQFLQTISNGSNLTISGLDTENSFFCYRIAVVDACSGETQLSNVICSASLTVEAMDGFHQLNWNTSTQLQTSYDIIKDGALFMSITDPDQLSLADTLVTCGTENCYSLNLDQGTFTYVTPQVCAIGIADTNPPPVNDITTTVSGNDVNLIWRIAEGGEADTVTIRRARGGQELEVIARTTDDSFVDESPGVNQASFTYDIFYEDACSNRSDVSNFTNTIFLTSTNTNGNVYDLSWNEYNGWFAGVGNYFVQKIVSGNLVDEEKVLSGFTHRVALTNLDREPVTFRVRAESLDFEPLESFSNSLTFEFTPALFVPAAFTPNGDGLNDDLFIQGTFVTSFEFTIYNRWGEVIFYSESINRSWDGTIKRRNAASGTYSYSLKFTDEQGQNFSRKGSFVLIR